MAAVELVLLQRVEKLGQMGDIVKVKPGYARNYLLPQKKALRASKEALARFEEQRAQLEAQNLKRREEAERVAERVGGLTVVMIRQAGEAGGLYGSVSTRDISDACTAAGLTITRQQVILEQPIKTLGIAKVRVELHPEVSIAVGVNVARSAEDAKPAAKSLSPPRTTRPRTSRPSSTAPSNPTSPDPCFPLPLRGEGQGGGRPPTDPAYFPVAAGCADASGCPWDVGCSAPPLTSGTTMLAGYS